MIFFQRCIICFIPTSGLEEIAKKRSLPLDMGHTIFKTALKPRRILKSVQHGEVAPNPELFNGILQASFRLTVKKLEKKGYPKNTASSFLPREVHSCEYCSTVGSNNDVHLC